MAERMMSPEGGRDRVAAFGWREVPKSVDADQAERSSADLLDPVDRKILQGLIDGLTIEEIMPLVDLERSAVYRRITILRDRFKVDSVHQLIAVVVYAGLLVPTRIPPRDAANRPGNRIYSTVRALTSVRRPAL
jgi:hypothetical protein